MRNLYTFMKENHGWEALRELQQWEKREFKQCDYKNHRIFTLRCLNKGLVLVSVRLNSNKKDISSGARNIIRRAEKQLLQDRVKCINGILQDNGGSITASKSRSFSIVTYTTIQQKCREFIDKVREVRFIKVRERQVSKFNRILHKNNLNGNLEGREQSPQLANNNQTSNKQMQGHTCIHNNQSQGSSNSNVNQGNKWVVNLSKWSLTPAQESLLSKGPNFVPAPTNPPNVEFISAIELACQRLLEQDAQELRTETIYLLRRAKQLPSFMGYQNP